MRVKLNGSDWYKVTSDFGNQNSAHSSDFHTGIDLSIPIGTELESPVDGVVERIVDYGNENIGRGIVIKTEDNETLILGHLSEAKVEVGQKVTEGDLVALSGNTGNSTGAHLHIGLKNEDGNFVDPDNILESTDDFSNSLADFIIKKEELVISSDGSTLLSGEQFVGNKLANNYHEVTQFVSDWKSEGFFHAMYGKSFFNVVKDFFAELFKDIGIFILGNADIFFLAPAIIFMFGTFIVGQNKFTKWIVPLWFAYFVASFFHKMMIA